MNRVHSVCAASSFRGVGKSGSCIKLNKHIPPPNGFVIHILVKLVALANRRTICYCAEYFGIFDPLETTKSFRISTLSCCLLFLPTLHCTEQLCCLLSVCCCLVRLWSALLPTLSWPSVEWGTCSDTCYVVVGGAATIDFFARCQIALSLNTKTMRENLDVFDGCVLFFQETVGGKTDENNHAVMLSCFLCNNSTCSIYTTTKNVCCRYNCSTMLRLRYSNFRGLCCGFGRRFRTAHNQQRQQQQPQY